MFWTQETMVGPVTLCESCALFATNLGVAIGSGGCSCGTCEESEGVDQFTSMGEAALVLTAVAAMGGLELEFSSNDFGVCEQCGRHAEEAQSA